MLSVRLSCRRSVCKLWAVCVLRAVLPTRSHTVRRTMFINIWFFRLVIRGVVVRFSTLFMCGFRLLCSGFYPVSTRPTSTTTSFINLFKLSCYSEGYL
jgi:hypothetical protein